MRRGDVWWVEAPDEEPRPYVILTRDEAIDGLEKLVAAPTTRTARGIVSEVQVGPADGMRVESIVSLDNIAVVPKEFMRRRVTALEPGKIVRRAGPATLDELLSNAPVDDEPSTPEEDAAAQAARAEIARGEFVGADALRRELL